MRIRTARFIVKEGVINTYRNKLMSLASVTIVIATLVIFGFFLLIALNFKLNLSIVKDQPLLVAFCDPTLDETQVKKIEDAIKSNDKIAEYQVVTKKQALEKMKVRLGDNASILDGLGEDILCVSFNITLKDSAQSTEVVNNLKSITGIQKVGYSQKIIDLISKISYWIQFASGTMIIILLIISIFIMLQFLFNIFYHLISICRAFHETPLQITPFLLIYLCFSSPKLQYILFL